MTQTISRAIVCLLVVCLKVGCNRADQTKILKLAHELDVNHPAHKAMVYMGQELEKKSNGKLRLKIYPNGQLGQERELLELLQIGSLDITKVGGGVMENFSSDYKIFGLPYLFRDRGHAYTVWDSHIGKQVLESSTSELLKGLAFLDAGSRNFYTKNTPIQSPQDLDGLKIRVQKSGLSIAMVQQLGASPTPIAWGELYTALQQGVVDGAENNLPSFYLSRHYEVCKYLSMDQHTYVPDILVMGTKSWGWLAEQEKNWVSDSAEAAAIYHRSLWVAMEEKALEEVKSTGVQVAYPDKSSFEQKVAPIYGPFYDDPEKRSVLEQIKQMGL